MIAFSVSRFSKLSISLFFSKLLIQMVFLWEALDDDHGTCTISEDENTVVFQMAKLQKGIEWPQLKKDLSREQKRVLRDQAVQHTQQRHSGKRKELQERRQEQKQMVVRDHIRLDGVERQRIVGTYSRARRVSFTPRGFSTPSLESTAAEEQEWLKKQAEARKKCGFNDAGLRPEERDPMWLLQKGESLMKDGSYLGAVSACSHGIKLAPKMSELYQERDEAHLSLKNLVKTVEDASQALELLVSKVTGNKKERYHIFHASSSCCTSDGDNRSNRKLRED
ncbi:unnamed protein product [Allacma fusca]|uniref:Uncharacterized protein n=1 Tax=Allacma fusca TaxID=39272 RepID=A0A8J2P5U2_9HEXA|nr:unnamed protein product [Allacma fusca]